MSKIKSRFCPSPTGFLHLGNLRTALFSYLASHKDNGSFLLRIEDTDQNRSKKEYSEAIFQDLEWMHLNWDEGPGKEKGSQSYFQSERTEIYASFYKTLLEKDLIYPCFMSEEELKLVRKTQLSSGKPPRYPGTWANASEEEVKVEFDKGNKPVYRFRMPKDCSITFVDQVKGEQSFDSNDLDDFIVQKEDGSPTFMFSNAIDDSLMEVNLVLRGEDHLSNTPRQIALLQSLGLKEPNFCHIALFTGNDGAPLSKRNGSMSLKEMREEGYLPQAITNYLSRVGHVISDNNLRSLKELSVEFDSSKISTSPSKFDIDQLNYWQKRSVEIMSDEELLGFLKDALHSGLPKDIALLDFAKVFRSEIVFPSDALSLAEHIFSEHLSIDENSKSILTEAGSDFFSDCKNHYEENYSDWKSFLSKTSSSTGKKGKEIFLPLRIALSGLTSGPELDDLTELLGKDRVLERFEQAANL